MRAQRLVAGIAGLLLIAFLVTGCGGASQPNGAAAGSDQTNKPIVIGATLALTGPLADTAKWAKAGYELWQDDVNARGGLLGRKVELKILDDEGNANKAVQLLEKLITVDKVDLILGAYGGPVVAAQAPVADKYQYTYIGMGGHGPSFAQGFKYFFGGPPLMAEWYPLAVLDWLNSMPADQRPKRIGMINVNNVIGTGLRSATIDYVKKKMPGVQIVMDELHETPLPSADALAAKVKQNQVDALLIGNNLQDSALILRALKAANYQPKMIWSCIGPSVPEWSQQLGDLGEYVTTGAPVSESAGPGAKKLNDLAMQKYHTPANLYIDSFFNYGAVLEAAVNGTKSFDNTKLRDYLKSHEIDTPLGKMKFDENGLPAPVSYMMQVQHGKTVLIWPKQPDSPPGVYPLPAWK